VTGEMRGEHFAKMSPSYRKRKPSPFWEAPAVAAQKSRREREEKEGRRRKGRATELRMRKSWKALRDIGASLQIPADQGRTPVIKGN